MNQNLRKLLRKYFWEKHSNSWYFPHHPWSKPTPGFSYQQQHFGVYRPFKKLFSYSSDKKLLGQWWLLLLFAPVVLCTTVKFISSLPENQPVKGSGVKSCSLYVLFARTLLNSFPFFPYSQSYHPILQPLWPWKQHTMYPRFCRGVGRQSWRCTPPRYGLLAHSLPWPGLFTVSVLTCVHAVLRG